jgi:integrase
MEHLEAQQAERHPRFIIDRSSTEELVQTWLQGRSKATVRMYKKDLELFLDWAADHRRGVRSLESFLRKESGPANHDVTRWRNWMVEQGYASATVNRRLSSIRSICALADQVGLITWRITVRDVKHKPYRDTRGPGAEAVGKMIKLARQRVSETTEAGHRVQRANARRDYAMLMLIASLGLRRIEIARLDLEDFDTKNGMIRVTQKGETEKTILYLPGKVAESITIWLEERGFAPGPLFFPVGTKRREDKRIHVDSISRIVKNLGLELDIKVTPHGIRHTSITEAMRSLQGHEGMSDTDLRHFSRHASLATAMIYNDRENAQEVQETLANDVLKVFVGQ